MVAQSTLRSQLASLNLHFWLFGRSEVRELGKILNSSEEIQQCAHGYYQGGSGLLVATNERLILIDKRPFYLNIEEMKYHEILAIKFESNFLRATTTVVSANKRLVFNSFSDARLKRAVDFVEQKMQIAKNYQGNNSDVSTDVHREYLRTAWQSRHQGLVPRSRLLRQRPTKFYMPHKQS